MTEKNIGINPEVKIDYGSNREEYHKVFGGKKGHWWTKDSDTPWAYETREILINIAKDDRNNGEPGTIKEISKKVNENISKDIGKGISVSRTQISMATRGLLGNTPMSIYNGKSPRDFVLESLRRYSQKKYIPEYII